MARGGGGRCGQDSENGGPCCLGEEGDPAIGAHVGCFTHRTHNSAERHSTHAQLDWGAQGRDTPVLIPHA